MKKNILFPTISDTIFFALISYVIFYVIFSDKFTSTGAAVAASAVSLICAWLIFTVSYALRSRAYKKAAYDDLNSKLIRALTLLTNDEFNQFCEKLTDSKDGFVNIGENKYTLVSIASHPNEPLTCNELLHHIRPIKSNRICLICTGPLSTEALALIRSIPVHFEIYSGEKIVELMREKCLFPEINDVLSAVESKTFSRFLHSAEQIVFNRHNSLRFLRYAAIMSIGAVFTRFNLYFSVSALIFTSLCILSTATVIKRRNQSRKMR